MGTKEPLETFLIGEFNCLLSGAKSVSPDEKSVETCMLSERFFGDFFFGSFSFLADELITFPRVFNSFPCCSNSSSSSTILSPFIKCLRGDFFALLLSFAFFFSSLLPFVASADDLSSTRPTDPLLPMVGDSTSAWL